MVSRNLIRCKYCSTKILLRFQLGDFDIPFAICCPECGVDIKGQKMINHLSISKLTNALIIEEDEKIDYFINLCFELPHKKIEKYESLNSLLETGFSPFMHTILTLELDEYQNSMNKIQSFLEKRIRVKKELLPLYQIYFKGKYNLITNHIKKFSEAYVIKNELDALMALHQIMITYFSPLLDKKALQEYNEFSRKIMLNLPTNSIENLIENLGGKQVFQKNKKRVLEMIERWYESFEIFIPAIVIYMNNATEKFDKLNYGISTASFNDFKNFYADSYELILDLVDVAVGLNNISERNDINNFHSEYNCENFETYKKLIKIKKLDKFVQNEMFSKTICLNRNIRNAIAHFNCTYNANTQEIIFNDKYNGRENTVKIYLIELAWLCYENMRIILHLNELLYVLEKINLVKQGLKPNIIVELLNKRT